MSHAELIAKYQQLGFRLLFWKREGSDPKDWKGPRTPSWNATDRVYDLSEYNPDIHNLGFFTGIEIQPRKYLADVDLDWADGVGLTRKLLPETQFGFGRKGKKISHAIYTTTEPADLSVYADITDEGDGDGINFVELRGGIVTDVYPRMTMIAPSKHSEGVFVELVTDGEIAHVELERLEQGVIDYAIGCLLLKRVPGGLHHDGRMALAGFLLKRGFTPERVIAIGQEVCAQQVKNFVVDMTARDVADMELVVETTVDRIKAEKNVAGGPKLAEFIGPLGKKVVARILKYIGASDTLVLDAAEPMKSAQVFVATRYTTDGLQTLYNQNKVFYQFVPPAYREHDEAAMRAEVWKFLDAARTRSGGDEPTLGPFKANTVKVNNVLDALRGVTNLPLERQAPCWLQPQPERPMDMLAFPNGLLHIPSRTLRPSTPNFFTLNGLDFHYDPNAPQPARWLKFLDDLWGGDAESIAALQEMFGYLLTPDMHLQKIFMLIGPKRSGKSVIGRILTKLVGERNVCKPTLATFGDQFGKQSLIGKQLAIIADARLSGRTDAASVLETLLAISGEDNPSVPRKFLPDWVGTLGVRFLLITNELPKIGDQSGALASRFIILALQQSFYGKEDLGLYPSLEPELPSILNWALEGRDRLYARRYFVQPTSASNILDSFVDLSSPQAAFITECTELGPAARVSMKDLFRAWKMYCDENGIEQTGTVQSFAKQVHATLPTVTKSRGGPRGQQERFWNGVRLNEEWVQKVTPEPEDEGM